MKRLTPLVIFNGLCLLACAGCATFLDDKPMSTVAAFTESLENDDLAGLRKYSTPEFQRSALRREDALEAIKLLNLPDGKAEIENVKEEGTDRLVVKASVGDNDRKVTFKLTRDPKSDRWLVDDMSIKRKLKPGQVHQTVSQQMDLLLGIRELMDGWTSDSREKVLEACTPELRDILNPLTAGCLMKLSGQVRSSLGSTKSLKPELRGHKGKAVVRYARHSGDVYVSLREVDGMWKVDEIQILAKKEENRLPSLRGMAAVMTTAVDFYDSYQQSDKARLKQLSSDRFFESTLSLANLKSIPLPDVDMGAGTFEVRLAGTHALVIAKNEKDVLQLTLSQNFAKPREDNGEGESPEEGPPTDDIVAPKMTGDGTFRVEEVTLHELDGKQEKRLSAMLTAHAIMQIFSEALATRNLKSLELSSTPDFNQRVWKRLKPGMLQRLPMDEILPEPPQISNTTFMGPITEIDVLQGGTPLVYVIREQSGTLLVDDVYSPQIDRPKSMKTVLETMIPILSLSDALGLRQVKEVRPLCSNEFNRLVWTQLQAVPAMPQNPVALLRGPLSKVTLAVDKAFVTLGTETRGVKVYLVKEGDQFVVDDLLIISGTSDAQRVSLKQYLRSQYVYGNSVNGRASLDESAAEEPLPLPTGPAAPLPSRMPESDDF
ncbi:MAG TPA: hypothetical protein VHB77_13115 [Planctomycetaceae bacterium]|nr:hypothetical protein [Planctomycetaceae bacterium]